MNTQEPTLILFDIDGTLLTPDGAGRVAYDLALAEMFGLRGVLDGTSFAGATDLQVLQAILPLHSYAAEQARVAMPAFTEVLARQMADIIDQHRVRALPGALALVQQLAQDQRARLGLVTGNTSLSAPVKLRAAGFDPALFPVGAFGDESADRSALPPLALQRARTHWRLDFEPARIVIVGDMPVDVICARSVGARAVAVMTGYAAREALVREEPYAILEDLTDLAHVQSVLFGEAP